jgi:hypothetical protein
VRGNNLLLDTLIDAANDANIYKRPYADQLEQVTLADPRDVIHFDVNVLVPGVAPTEPVKVWAVCDSVDERKGVATYRSVVPCEQTWPLQPCEEET